jgi:predicted O-methyltransferase YrrM
MLYVQQNFVSGRAPLQLSANLLPAGTGNSATSAAGNLSRSHGGNADLPGTGAVYVPAGEIDWSRTLEVGVFTGYSSLCVALALPRHGKLIACDINKEWTDVARKYWREAGVDKIIHLRLAPAIETMDDLLARHEAGKYDFIFIDADKGNYDGYYERALSLLRPGGLMAIDNVFWGGKVADTRAQDRDTKAIRALNEKIRDDRRVDISMIPIGDGLTIVRKR